MPVVLIGYGTGGSIFHAPFINACQGMKLAAVVTSNKERQEAIARTYPGTKVYDGMEAMLQDREQFQLAVITTPNHMHHSQARSCLEAGLHVVVDKPFCLTAAQAEDLIAQAQASGKIISPYHNRRFDSDFLTLRKVLEENLVGTPFRLESRIERFRARPKPGGWRETTSASEGGGVLYDLGSHLIDQAIALFGPPDDIYGKLQERRGLGVEDDLFLALDYKETKLQVHLYASMACLSPGPRFTLSGSTGAFIKEKGCPQEDMLKAGVSPLAPHFGQEPASDWGSLLTDGGEKHKVETVAGNWLTYYQTMRLAILDGAPPPVPARAAWQGLKLMEKLRERC
ncbi:MAG: Gfo/Idh/MocA family oxidoreductase [Candidatus Melainabacteria bacterium]|nr:Gfo/Idh/MocA family oxidoreductase [Candidatus Melainabacteria bacterium]